MRRAPVLALALSLALLLAGCAGSPPPPDRFFRLDPPAPPPLAHAVLPGVVEVERLGAEGLTAERAILYSRRQTPEQVARQPYALWTEPPPAMLQHRLVDLLRAAGAAPAVVTAELRVPPDYVVQGRLRRFEQVLGPAPAVVVEMELGVVRLHGGDLRLLRRYHVEQPLTGDGPSEAVAGFDAAVAELFRRFLADLASSSSSLSQDPSR